MLQGLTQLLELQRLEDELHSSKTEYEGLPARRDRLAEQRKTCEDRLSATKQAVEEAESSMRQAESALQDREALLEKLESQQFQVKSNDAYTALLREMDQARESISEQETKILESMEAIESSKGEFTEAKGEIDTTQSALEDEDRSITARDAELIGEIERLSNLRNELAPKVGRELLHRYERIAQRRRPAVVLVTEERCGGCRVVIPPQSFIEVLRGNEIVTCGNCARILIHAERVEAQVAS